MGRGVRCQVGHSLQDRFRPREYRICPRAVNLGARHATGERLLIINPDAVLLHGSVRALEAALVPARKPALVGGKLFYSNGQEQRGGRRELLTLGRAFINYFGLSKLEPVIPALRDMHREGDPEPDGPVHMPVVSGALCYMTAADFAALGGFDEGYFLHVEDIDLCRRVGEAGEQVMFTPKAGALHYGSTSRVSAMFVEWNKAKGLTRYFRKNAGGPFETMIASVAILPFAGLLMGRSLAIRSVLEVRAFLTRHLSRKYARARKAGGDGVAENSFQPTRRGD